MAKTTLTIVSWNIRQGGGSRTRAILDALKDEDPDIIVLSEYRNNLRGFGLRGALLQRGYACQVPSAAEGSTNTVLIASRIPCGSALFPRSDPNYPDAIVRVDLPVCLIYGVYFPHKKRIVSSISCLKMNSRTKCHRSLQVTLIPERMASTKMATLFGTKTN